MAEISFSVFSNSTISGESWDRTPLAEGHGLIKTGRQPSHPGVNIIRQLAEFFDGFFQVVRQRIHLAIHPGDELAGVLKRIFQGTKAGGQVRVVNEPIDTGQGRFQMLFQLLEIQLLQGIGQLGAGGRDGWESRYSPLLDVLEN